MIKKTKKKNFHIAIDGPAGAGKSTVAKLVAESLGICYLDTGAMYRVIAYKALQANIPLEDEQAVTNIANTIEISFDHENDKKVYCNGEDVTNIIRTSEVTRAVSIIATYPGVRAHLVKLQRQEAAKESLVMDGRDIGTYVLPNAGVKIYLTASPEERAKRRYLEDIKKDKTVSLEEVMNDMENRDRQDSEREHAPLKPAEDAIILDTTGRTVEEVVGEIVRIVGEA